MEEHKIVENELPEKLGDSPKLIFMNKNRPPLENFSLGDYPNVEECVFSNCHIKTMEIIKIKRFLKIIFVNCRIKGLKIEQSGMVNIKFIDCEIYEAKFIDSNLPGMVFSRDRNKYINSNVRDKIKGTEGGKKTGVSRVLHFKPTTMESEFLFCDMNEMRIKDSAFNKISIKHCRLDKLKISKNVEMKNVNLRGSKISESNLGECKFNGVRFNKGFFIFEFSFFLFRVLLQILLHIFFIFPVSLFERTRKSEIGMAEVKENAWECVLTGKWKTERVLYKFFLFSWLRDILSPTDFKDVQYKEAYYPIDCHLFWHIEDLDFIHGFKKKHPFIAFIFFVMSNYMRSVFALFCTSMLVIFLFSCFYSTQAKFDDISVKDTKKKSELINNDGSLKYPFTTSVDIFINSDISPLKAKNRLTKIAIIFEKISGFFSLSFLLSMIFFTFSRRSSMPPKRWKDDFP